MHLFTCGDRNGLGPRRETKVVGQTSAALVESVTAPIARTAVTEHNFIGCREAVCAGSGDANWTAGDYSARATAGTATPLRTERDCHNLSRLCGQLVKRGADVGNFSIRRSEEVLHLGKADDAYGAILLIISRQCVAVIN